MAYKTCFALKVGYMLYSYTLYIECLGFWWICLIVHVGKYMPYMDDMEDIVMCLVVQRFGQWAAVCFFKDLIGMF